MDFLCLFDVTYSTGNIYTTCAPGPNLKGSICYRIGATYFPPGNHLGASFGSMGNTELNLALLLMNSSKPYCKKKFYRADRFYSSKYDEKITMPTVILLVNVVVSFT